MGRLCSGSAIGGGLYWTNRAVDEKVQACSAHQMCCTSDSALLPCRTLKTQWASRRPWTGQCWWPSTRRAVRLEWGGWQLQLPQSTGAVRGALAVPVQHQQRLLHPACILTSHCRPLADLLMNAFGLSEDAALAAISLGVDFGVTQLVRAGCAAGGALLMPR